MLPHRLLERRRLQQHRRPVHMGLTMPPLLLLMLHHGKAAVVVLLRHLYPLQRQAYCLCHMITMGFRNMVQLNFTLGSLPSIDIYYNSSPRPVVDRLSVQK